MRENRQTNLRLSDKTREMLIVRANRERLTNSEIAERLLALGVAADFAGYQPGDAIPPKAQPPRRTTAATGISTAGMFRPPPTTAEE